MYSNLNSTLQQLNNKLVPYPTVATGIIKFVNYSTRHIRVIVKGYGVIRNIAVQEGINLGTTDRPIIKPNDIADIHLRPHEKVWICTAIHRKIKCSTDTPGIDPNVEVETSVESADSFTVQQISALETPFDLRLPPIEALGQITLPEFRFPEPTIYLCGIPQCTDCAPNGYTAGMAIILSTDDDHPFCWVWGFRRRGCSGSPAYQSTFDYDTGIYSGAPAATFQVRTHVSAMVAYTAVFIPSEPYTSLQVIDASNPAALVIVGATTIPFTSTSEQLYSINSHGTLLFVNTGLPRSAAPGFLGYTYVYDVSDPTTPTLIHTWSWTQFIFGFDGGAGRNEFEVYEAGGSTYMIGLYKFQSSISVSNQGFKIIDITNLSAPVDLSTTQSGVGETFVSMDYNNGLFMCGTAGANPSLGKIWIYDVSVPAVPALASLTDIGGNSLHKALRANNQYLFVGIKVLGGNPLLYILDLSNPSSPTILSTTNLGTGNLPQDLEPCSNFVYIGYNTTPATVQAFDVTVPAVPVGGTIVSTVDSFVQTLQVENGVTYMSGKRVSVPQYPAIAML